METSITRLHPSLPIFELARPSRSVLYTPGHLAIVSRAEAQTVRSALLGESASEFAPTQGVAARLRLCAERAIETWRERAQQSFAPECLTVCLSNLCNLACTYCYSAGVRAAPDRPAISDDAVLGAARLVARCASQKGKPLQLVLHGGGEPTVHWKDIERFVFLTRQAAAEAGVEWSGYIASNAVLPSEKAAWLARHFNLVGVSCDGPPDIQDRQRPLAGGGPSSSWVERAAQAIREAGGQLTVRATITPETVERQPEIVRYLHRKLGATRMRFEPVYCAGGGGFEPAQAGPFAEHFLAAQRAARSLGCDLSTSVVRLDEIHGPYCNVLKDVLHLLPDGTATACFLADSSALAIGRWQGDARGFVLDRERIRVLRAKLLEIPDRCQDCINIIHCARECPESCYASDRRQSVGVSGFRCLLAQRLAESWILDAAETGVRQGAHPRRTAPSGGRLAHLLADAPASVDRDEILRQWERVQQDYSLEERSLPAPVWAQRGFEDHGPEAWRQLSRVLAGCSSAGAISIYVHVPFCDRRCGFCDCYSLPLSPRSRHKEQAYAQALVDEIRAWAGAAPLARRPVTTVHFGGGTPNWLSPGVFRQIVEEIKGSFRVTPRTEWALESTSSLLRDEHLSQLRDWGFRRLHVGIQTLEEETRKLIGRRAPARAAVAKLECALKMGLIVSVDIVYGLPRQSFCGLLASLEELASLGVEGFSLYELQVTARNRKFLERACDYKADPLRNYAMFQAAHQCLLRCGYRKNHFTHFARSTDENLYYTYARRGEDLLALGPTADGVFDSYWYRHPELAEYMLGAGAPSPRLEGGVPETSQERRLRPAMSELMSGGISKETLLGLGAGALLQKWLRCGLLIESPGARRYALSGAGSWLISSMQRELNRYYLDPA